MSEPAEINAAVAQARAELWRRGEITYKLDATQRRIWAALDAGGRKFCMLASRRIGKSYTLVLRCVSQALKRPNLRVSYSAPFARDASEIATDLMTDILSDCPEDLRPEYKTSTKEYVFRNGSTIRFAGLNAEHANQLRGRKADIFCIDEMALVDDLKHVISDIALPMTLTTGGQLLFATTPARSPSHDSTAIIKKMQNEGQVVSFTLLDNVRVHDDIKAEYLIEAGEDPLDIPGILAGTAEPKTTTALREYFCRLDVTDSDSAVLPEFTAQAAKEICIDVPLPAFYDTYVALDPGQVDRTGALFGYWDFPNKRLVIQDEFLLSRPSTDDIVYALEEKEKLLWGGKRPLLRVCDGNLLLINDMLTRNGIAFVPGNNKDAIGGVDLVRTMIRRRELVISPNCTGLIRQAKYATFNRRGNDFDRSAEDGHFDLLAALRLMCRAIVRTKNPFPHWYGNPGFGTHVQSPQKQNKTVFSDTPLGRRLAKKFG